MTASRPPVHPTPGSTGAGGEAGRARDRSVPLLVAAGLLVVAVVAAVLIFGVERPPPVEPLGSGAGVTPPAAIAWSDRGAGENCLRAADPDGDVREVVCDLGGELVGWSDEGILVREWRGGTERVVAVDPATGDRRTVGRDVRSGAVPTTTHWTEREDGRLTVSLDPDDTGEPTVLWEVEAPSSYDVVTAVASPDGTVVALGDSAGRLLVVPSDGGVEPRLWSDEVPEYARFVWQGTRPLTD